MPVYTKNVRPAAGYTNGVKQLLPDRSGLDPSVASDDQLDHVVPLAVGARPRKLDSLELKPWDEAKRIDRIEKLQCLVCAGQVALAPAQREFVKDWQGAYHRYAWVKCLHGH